jgi:hypothetical protein
MEDGGDPSNDSWYFINNFNYACGAWFAISWLCCGCEFSSSS